MSISDNFAKKLKDRADPLELLYYQQRAIYNKDLESLLKINQIMLDLKILKRKR